MLPINEQTAEQLLAGCDSFFATNYVILRSGTNAHQLPRDHADAIGYSGLGLDIECAHYLITAGRWRGRGPAQIFNAQHFEPSLFVGTVIHEAAHHVAWRIFAADENPTQHGPLWLRATLHLWTRASGWLGQRGGPAVSMADVFRLSGYSLSAGWEYHSTLRDEIDWANVSPGTSIVQILRSTPPPAFRDLANRDAATNGWPRPFAA